MEKEVKFCDLRQKDVINCKTGDRLGNVIDLEFDIHTGLIYCLIVPKENRVLACIGKHDIYHIPFKRVVRIGKDTILVDVIEKECLK